MPPRTDPPGPESPADPVPSPRRATRRRPRLLAAAATGLGLAVASAGVLAVVLTGESTAVPRADQPTRVSGGPLAGAGLDADAAERLRLILDRAAATEPPDGPVATAAPAAPRRLLIPSLGVDAGVVPVDAPDRALLPPSDPDLLGWWAEGAVPGAARGSALITGHSVHTGGGALQDLASLAPGDEVVVETASGSITYAVSQTRVLDKPALAREAGVLFDQRAAGRMVLITCEDWDGTEWLSNTVVTAEPVADGA